MTNGNLQVLQNNLRVHQVAVEASAALPTLVFLHDALGSIAQWKGFPLKLALRSGLNAVAYDRCGHGGSGPLLQTRNKEYLHREALEILPDLLQQLQIPNPILIGHSDGGTIALIYAAYHQPTAIITEAAHAFVEEITLQGIREAVSRKGLLLQKLTRYHGAKTEALFNAWADTWLDEGFRDWSLEALLPRINCPALIIQGQQDQYGSEQQLGRIVNGIGPSANAVRIKHCGHTPHRQAEEAVLEEMAAFIETVVSG
ncbi:MAG: alpha/beta hydrolase [Lewinellaceae bacterium]|nr:alpha/beta hydrolase [Phaeodactylibacter sp.]MCB0613477.1 alpha/beta hydrolase [Phaeodactylibacter sp.]MCB9348027.1 alpha/beta hydrolase [Lewinellaceae bacterium]